MQQQYEKYTEDDHAVWQILFERQMENLKGKAVSLYLDKMEALAPVLNGKAVPNFKGLNNALLNATGWQIHVVPGLIPPLDFFALMAERKFCSSTWLRKRTQLDYLEEPDMFHDIFGHIPLLMDPAYAKLMQQMGEMGVAAGHDAAKLDEVERLYWFTIEFGVLQNGAQREIYGAGILSSFGEAKEIFSPKVEIKPWNLEELMHTPFDKSMLQPYYYGLPNWDTLTNTVCHLHENYCGEGKPVMQKADVDSSIH